MATQAERIVMLESQVKELFARSYERDRSMEAFRRDLGALDDRVDATLCPDPLCHPEPKRYVKVLFDGDRDSNRLYTYEDATAQGLQVGDAVLVPVQGGELTALVVRTNVDTTGAWFTIKKVSGVL